MRFRATIVQIVAVPVLAEKGKNGKKERKKRKNRDRTQNTPPCCLNCRENVIKITQLSEDIITAWKLRTGTRE